MKKRMILFLVSVLLLPGCSKINPDKSIETNNMISSETEREDTMYYQIDQETARHMMDGQDVIILDVREQEEYDSGHITDAVLLPVGTIDEETAALVIPDKDTIDPRCK